MLGFQPFAIFGRSDTQKRLRTSTSRLIYAMLASSALVLASPAAHAAETTPNHVHDVGLRTEGAATEILVTGTVAPIYTMRIADGGSRLIVDISSSDVVGVPAALTTPSGIVGGVMTQAFKTDTGSLTRVTVNLTKKAAYRLKADGDKLAIQLLESEKTEAASGILLARMTELLSVKSEPAPTVALTGVVVEHEKGRCEKACDRVIISASAPPEYTLRTAQDGRLRLEIKGVSVPEGLAHTTDATGPGSTLRAVTASFDAKSKSAVVEIDRDGDASGAVSVEGNKLIWTFDARKGAARTTDAKGNAVRKTQTVAREQAGADVPKVETSIHGDEKVETFGGGEAAGFTSGVNAQAAGRYNGRRIDLDLKDADIHNILRLLADVGRVNIVTADDVAGSVTIRMRNVPWDQALDVVLQAKSLGMVRSGNLIRVAPLDRLQKERELRLAAAKQEYELTPLETRLIPVSYASADELQARAKDLLSPRGSIAVDERTNVLISRDISGNLNNIEELIRSLDTQTPQVLIEARIVEATSRYGRDLGIQWGGDSTFSSATGNPTGVAFPSRVTTSGGAYDGNTPTAGLSPFVRNVTQPNFAVNLPAAVGTGQGGAIGFNLGSIDNNFNLTLRLSASEASGLLRIVSSPRILTLDNREARINQGTLIPFSQISAQGVQTTFQEAKLQLLVKPHVTAEGSVSMHVKINRDEPDFNQTSARGDPTILKREAETDLLVMDGHTAVIGGIYTRNTGRNLDQVPFFGDIPILGVLFQRRRASDTRNELIIFLTPRIVNRAEALGR